MNCMLCQETMIISREFGPYCNNDHLLFRGRGDWYAISPHMYDISGPIKHPLIIWRSPQNNGNLNEIIGQYSYKLEVDGDEEIIYLDDFKIENMLQLFEKFNKLMVFR